LPNFEKKKNLQYSHFFPESFGIYQVLEKPKKLKFPAHSDSDFSLLAFFN
jgi:hypothetical protein